MKSAFLPLLAAVCGGLAACSSTSSTMESSGEYLPAAKSGAFRNYRWILDPQEDEYANPYSNSSVVHTAIQRAVDGELGGKGYAKNPGAADFEVGYLLVVKEGASTAVVNRYFGYDRTGEAAAAVSGLSPEMMTRTYSTGSLVIDLLDMRTRRLVYRGTVMTDVDRSRSPEEREAHIREAVSKALEKLPVA